MSEQRIVVVSSTPKETRALAGVLAGACRPGDLLLLEGDLGAGKTTFAQGFAAGLGVSDAVTSPTFTLVREHRCGPEAPAGLQRLLHADLYRLDHLAEVVDLALGEQLEDAAVALVEWGDVAQPVLGAGALHVRIGPVGEPSCRRIELLPSDGPTPDGGAPWSGRWAALVDALRPWAEDAA